MSYDVELTRERNADSILTTGTMGEANVPEERPSTRRRRNGVPQGSRVLALDSRVLVLDRGLRGVKGATLAHRWNTEL